MNGRRYKPALESEKDPRLGKYAKIAERSILKASREAAAQDVDVAVKLWYFTSILTPANLLLARLKELLQSYPFCKQETNSYSKNKSEPKIILAGKVPAHVKKLIFQTRWSLFTK